MKHAVTVASGSWGRPLQADLLSSDIRWSEYCTLSGTELITDYENGLIFLINQHLEMAPYKSHKMRDVIDKVDETIHHDESVINYPEQRDKLFRAIHKLKIQAPF